MRGTRKRSLVTAGVLGLIGLGLFLWKSFGPPSESVPPGSDVSSLSAASPLPSSSPASLTGTASTPSPTASAQPTAALTIPGSPQRPVLFRGLESAPSQARREDRTLPPLPKEFPAYPRMESYRAEARKNPHTTPPLLNEFALAMSPWMEHALRADSAPSIRLQTAQRLSECSRQNPQTTPPSVMTFCWMNLRDLLKAFPQDQALQEIGREADQKLSPATRAQARALERI